MHNNQLGQDEATWPPDYTLYLNYTTSELSEALKRESNSINAPKSYRNIMTRLSEQLEDIQSEKKLIDSLMSKANLYSKYVRAAEENYGSLAELYKEERKSNLKQAEEIITLHMKIKTLEQTYEAKEQRIKQQVEQMQSVFNDRFERQKDDFTKTANKQAMGRRNIEDKLIMKEAECADLRKKLQDLEEKTKDFDRYKVENSQLKLLVTYLQNPQQQISAQKIQQQMQQNQQHY